MPRRAIPLLIAIVTAGAARAQFAGPFPIPFAGDGTAMKRFGGYMQMRVTERGMPLNVNAIALDRERTLWLALEDGLLRCDGDRHTLYQHMRADSNSLPSNTVTDVRAAADGSVWLGTQNGLARMDPASGAFKRYRIRSDSVNAVKANRFWQVVPLPQGGAIALNELGPQLVAPNGSIRAILLPGADVSALPYHLLADRDRSGAWFASQSAIHWIGADGRAQELRAMAAFNGLSIQRPLCLSWTPEGRLLWLDGDRHRLVEADLATGTWEEREPSPLLNEDGWQARDLLKGADGSYWIATWSNRIHITDSTGGHHALAFPDERTALGPQGALATRAMLLDEEGRLWLATSHGALALLPADARAQRIPLPLEDARRAANGLARLPDGRLVIGTYREGLLVEDAPGSGFRRIVQRLPKRGQAWRDGENTITACVPLDSAHLLVATYHGIQGIDLRRGSYVHRDDLEALDRDLVRKHIIDLVADTGGWFWAASWMHGLYRFHPTKGLVKRYTHAAGDPHSLPIDRLLCLLLDNAGELWIGCNDGGGLCRYRRGTDDFERIRLATNDDQGMAFGVVRALAQDADGALWIGTHKGGLARYDPVSGGTQAFDRTQGVPGDLITAIACDRALGTWVQGPAGIAKWYPEEGIFQRFGPGIEWAGSASGLKLIPDQGQLVALNGSELVRIDLLAPAPRVEKVRARLLAVRINGVQAADAMAARLTQERDRLVIDFALSDPIRAQGARAAYRLAGLSAEWTDCLGCRSASFGDLPAGRYRFEVKVLGDDGEWSAPTTLASFLVAPPWWATWWFRLAAAAALAIGAWLGFRAYVRRRLQQEREHFEREQAVLRERERIASDMHDDLGAGLSGLKLRSEMALRVEQDPAKREQLALLAATAGELIGSMRQMIWAMDEGQGTVHDLLSYATSYARNYCVQHGLSIDVHAAEGIPDERLSAQQRRNIFLVIKEALHNCVKHAQASRVTLTATWHDGLCVSIADDGIGLPKAADAGTGNGMRNMRKRMLEVGGTFTADAENGTAIRIHVPLPRT